ncbi:MAG TPA: A/G-specific adenine glycosylase [Bacteroidales bacterium]|nr:A/G-specific adenine glycosylase [Bacteroidales bacterium]HPT09789.1 A/G-specific adenine glycosylase [Bacteroidales bacterium]
MDFTHHLIRWYDEHKRDLPWRRTHDPYLIWISEIILQQTRIDQGLPYYERFVALFPDVETLATAEEREVLKAWQGLGYYSRACNLHKAAVEVVNRYGGVFPSLLEDIRSLPGIGAYTAAAIGSIAFHLPVPVIDGNVLRFLARYFGVETPVDVAVGKKRIADYATASIDLSDPGTFNQAVMEFGAMVCTPLNPACGTCIFRDQCRALSTGSVLRLPVKSKTVTQRIRHFNYLVITTKGEKSVIMKRREQGDIWKGLYDFPLIESSGPLDIKKLQKEPEWLQLPFSGREVMIGSPRLYRHVLTHQVIMARFFRVSVKSFGELPEKFLVVKRPDQLPVPRLVEKYITRWTNEPDF